MPLPTTSNTSNPRSHGYHIRIEDNFWQVISAPDRPFDLLAQAGRIPTAREFISSPEDVPRSEHTAEFGQTDFSGGEGLDFAHRPDNTDFDKTRFWASDGIEVIEGHGDVQKIQIEHDYSVIYDQADFATSFRHSPQMVTVGDSLFVIGNGGDKSKVTRIDDPTGTSTANNEDPVAGASSSLFSIAEVDGLAFVSSNGDGIYKRDAGGTWANIHSLWPQRMWGLKGRLLCTDNEADSIFEVDVNGNSQPRVINLGTGGRFMSACDAGAAILTGATNGYVYALADVDGTLTLRAQTRFHGEEITALGAGPSGIVLVGTKEGTTSRLYMSELGAAYTLQNTQLLREWTTDATDEAAISHIRFTRNSAYFGFEDTSNNLQLWRFDVTTTGLFKIGDITTGAVGGIDVVEGKVFICTDGHDVYREEDTYQSSGHLISPLFDHFSPEDKVWAAAKLFGVNLPPNTQAQLFYSTNPDAIEDSTHASWLPIKTLTNTTGVDDVETVLTNAESRWITLKLELSTTDNTATPQVRGYSVRSYAGEGDWELTVPVNVSDVVVRPGHKPTKVPGLGSLRYDTLKTYEGGAVTLEWLYQDETFEGTVEQVGLRSPLQPRRGGNLMVAEVRFIGRRT